MFRHLVVCDACEKTEPCDIQRVDPRTVEAFRRAPVYVAPLNWKRIYDMGLFCSWRCLADWASCQEEAPDAQA